jgi:hypothetical protein
MVSRFVEQQHVRPRQQQFAERRGVFAARQVRATSGIPWRQPSASAAMSSVRSRSQPFAASIRLQIALPFEKRIHRHHRSSVPANFAEIASNSLSSDLISTTHLLRRCRRRASLSAAAVPAAEEADFDAPFARRASPSICIDAGHARLNVDLPEPFGPNTPILAPGKRQRDVLQDLAPAGHDLGNALHGEDVLRHQTTCKFRRRAL